MRAHTTSKRAGPPASKSWLARGRSQFGLLIFLAWLALPCEARALEWDLGVNAGIGAFFGTGWDANRPGGSLTVAGGPRLHKYFSVHALFLMEAFRLRTADDLHRNGEFFAWMVAPEIHPLGRRDGVTPYITPLVGYSYEIGRVSDPGATVKFASRAAVVGGMLGCTWPLAPSYALGFNILLVRMFGGQSCMQSDAGGTSCNALEKGSTRLGAAQVTFQMAFGTPKGKSPKGKPPKAPEAEPSKSPKAESPKSPEAESPKGK